MPDLHRGDLVWADFSPTRGREQAGLRPALVIATGEYLDSIPNLVIVLPVTTIDRGLPPHVRLRGDAMKLPEPSWALTEQPRTITRERLTTSSGCVDEECLAEVEVRLRDFLGLY